MRMQNCAYILFQSQIESGQEDEVLRRHITLHVFLILPSLKLLTSMCPLPRCAYSLTWLGESLRSLITSNGWLVPTKVWDFLINTFRDSSVSECWTGLMWCFCAPLWEVEDVWVATWFGCIMCVCVCIHACVCAGSDSFCQEVMKWHLGGS